MEQDMGFLSEYRLRGAVAATGIAAIAAACTPQANSGGSSPATAQPVQIMTVVPTPATDTRHYTGVVRPRVESDLAFRVGGKIVSRNVDIGQTVAAGQLIAKLDETDLRLALDAQEAELGAAMSGRAQAVASEARFEALFAKGHVARAALDQRITAADEARARVTRAERNVEIARNQLSYARLEAATQGVVSSLSAEAGQVVGAGQTVVRIAELGDLEVAVAVPEHMAASVQAATAEIDVWNSGRPPIPARLRELSPEADRVTRTYQARFSLPAGSAVELGRTATVALRSQSTDTVVRLPLAAIMNDGRAAHVYVLDENGTRVKRTPVTIASLDQSFATVTSGLKSGDRVVALGAHRLDEGRPVRVVEQRADTDR